MTLEDCHYRLRQALERDDLASIISARLRYAPSVRAREEFLGRMRELLAVPVVATREKEATLPLTWEQVCEMQVSGLISF